MLRTTTTTTRATAVDGRGLQEGLRRSWTQDARPWLCQRSSSSANLPPLRAKSSDTPLSGLLTAAATESLESNAPRGSTPTKNQESVYAALKKLPRSLFEEGSENELIMMYRSMVSDGHLQSALFLLEQFLKADRGDVLRRVIQKDFLKRASRRNAVKEAIEFVELLPDSVVDCRTYNMLATVCIRAKDSESAFLTSKLMQKRGIKMDLPMYTNLILAIGTRGDVNAAFQLYTEMKDHGLVPDCMVVNALANVCAAKLKASKWSDRRANLVLLERASSLLHDLNQFRVPPDTTLCNVLVTCAGRAGQMQRAFDMLQDMKQRNCQADSVTYGSLIDACVKAERRDLALRVYDLALDELPKHTISLYTVALEACMCGPEPVYSDRAFEIYRQAQKSGQPLDVHFFSTMIRVAGKAGMPDLALSIEDNMRIKGIEHSTITCSALISASVASNDLKLASKIYSSMLSKGIFPNLHQVTNLMQAYARVHRFGDMVRLVEDMVMHEMVPDDVMSDILFSFFKDASMADLAFAVFTLLRGQNVPLTERVCYSMLDICHIQIKSLQFLPPKPCSNARM